MNLCNDTNYSSYHNNKKIQSETVNKKISKIVMSLRKKRINSQLNDVSLWEMIHEMISCALEPS